MPFKLRLKKSRQYNVVSKSLFVICVELLDGSSMECTLSGESTGQECLDNVCQRLGLQQHEYFGLRYIALNGMQRWLEMDRPVKRQLDKHASKLNLYLRVMYYVLGVSQLQDEMTRYHYFLQLKMDVIEGRMSCDARQAIQLAAFSMQAEYGNHDMERHTIEYLKDLTLFPKHLLEYGHADALLEGVIKQHRVLRGVAPCTAEEHYIQAAQQLDGYGQELFQAVDETGSNVIIGVSLTGVGVGYDNNQLSKFYKWKDITNVVNHKRYFVMECQVPDRSVQFQFSDVESAKYVWRMCVYQHKFFMQHEPSEPGEVPAAHNLFTQSATELAESHEELDAGRAVTWGPTWTSVPTMPVRAQSTSCLDLATPQDMDRLRALLPSYRPAPDYETAVQQKYHSGAQQEAVPANVARPITRHQLGVLYSSQPEIHQTHLHESLNCGAIYKHYPDVARVERRYIDANTNNHALIPTPHTYSTPDLDVVVGHQPAYLQKPPPPYPINRPSSNSTPDLASQALCAPRPHLFSPQVSGSSPDLVSSRSLGMGRMVSLAGGLRGLGPPLGYSLLPNPESHRTYTNLAAAAIDPHIQHVEELHRGRENGGLNKIMNGTVAPPQQFRNMPVSVATSAAQAPEPIYENIPLPWAAEGRETTADGVGPRSRASSIQSAPEMSRGLELLNSSNSPLKMGAANASISVSVAPIMIAHSGVQHHGSHSKLYTSQERLQQQPQSLQQVPQQQVQQLVPQQSTILQQPQQTMPITTPQQPHQQQTKPLNALVFPPQQHQQQHQQQHSQPQHSQQQLLKQTHQVTSSQQQSKLSALNIESSPHSITNGNHTPPSQVISGLSSQRLLESVPVSVLTDPGQPPRPHGPHTSHNTSATSTNSSMDSSSSSGKTTSRKGRRLKWAGLTLLGGTRDKDRSDSNSDSTNQHHWGTALPRVPLPSSVSKETLCQLLEKKLVDSQLFFEFEKIPKKRQNAEFTAANHPDNIARNRFKEVLPYDENRVRLTPSKENRQGYINASHITATVGNQQRFYVAAQGPQTNTLVSFWQMVWEADIYLVVNLLGANEDGAIPYLPTNIADRSLDLGDFQVWWQFSQEMGHCVTTKLRLFHAATRRVRGVWHLQYPEWGDQGCPNSVSHFLGFLEELNSVRQHTVSEIPPGHNRNPPVLVHCSAGVGRTGVAILSDLLLYTLDHNQELDIPRVVALLRHQRMHMLQTVAQYRFVHSLLIHYLRQSRLI
ncbi:Tyrosine-protein phosphatase non-receptor type 21 [Frankliniella fusca]|uniref:protein-tyrosine-phosphatase n=1 Tax=Frankliniella fusca TaxID=407009 RepID=A0AAE1LPZ9_9NEOP|nr:Tyrosine-protein phosphatase non-receptor type 21 [Frankliniella fusca]